MTDCRREFPANWFIRAKLCAERHDARLNYFGVNASQSLATWRRKGWIRPHDPRGWFQWYCRYYMGRRHADDARQIRRWRAIARHVAAIQRNCEPRDLECRRTAASGRASLGLRQPEDMKRLMPNETSPLVVLFASVSQRASWERRCASMADTSRIPSSPEHSDDSWSGCRCVPRWKPVSARRAKRCASCARRTASGC